MEPALLSPPNAVPVAGDCVAAPVQAAAPPPQPDAQRASTELTRAARRAAADNSASNWPLSRHLGDLRAGWVSAVIMLPQAVAFAVIAGLPAEMGIYASVIPVMVAAVLGREPRLISGPNTAVAVMLGAALLPLAVPGSSEYIALAITLTAMVGLAQLTAAVLGAGRLLCVLPDFVPHGLSAGIGLAMIISQVAAAAGLLPVRDAAPWLSAWLAVLRWNEVQPCALAVTAATLLAGALSSRWKVRALQPLIAALLAGTLTSLLLDTLLGAHLAGLERVGRINLEWLPWTTPALDWNEWYVLKQLAWSAVAIGVVGGLQTVVIVRSLPAATGVPRSSPSDARRELLAQGSANLAAAICGGFAGSGSFNRTSAHVMAGARGRLGAIFSALILLGLAWLGGPMFSAVPTAAVAATVGLIGWSMLRSGFATLRRAQRGARIAAALIGLSAVASGLETSLLVATCLGFLAILLERTDPGKTPATTPRAAEAPRAHERRAS